MSQVDAVRRKLMGAVYKSAIDHAVDSYGYSREKLEEVLVLCGTGDKIAKRWNAFCCTPEQVARDADARKRDDFELDEFIAFVRAEVEKEKQHGRTTRRRHRRHR